MASMVGKVDRAEIEKYRQYAPESKTDADIEALVLEKKGDEGEVQRVISVWWEQALAGTATDEADPDEAPEDVAETPDTYTPSDANPAIVNAKENTRSHRESRNSISHRHSRESRTFDGRAGERRGSARGSRESRDVSSGKSSKGQRDSASGRPRKKAPPKRVPSMRSNSSQVRLLAEHCFTLSDEAVASLVRYKIPTQSRWDYKQKIHVRDETIKHLQRALDLLNQEKQRFKTACTDIETTLQDEVAEVKSMLAVQLATGGSSGSMGMMGGSANDAGLREELADLKAENKELVRRVKAMSEDKKLLSTELAQAKESAMRMQFEKKEEVASKSRNAGEVLRLTDELGNVRKALETKNKELSMALASFSEFQHRAEQREKEIGANNVKDDMRIAELEDEKVALVQQMADLKTKLATEDTQLGAVKESLSEAKAEVQSLKAQIDSSKQDSSKTAELLATERGLRARAELKEEEERRERIAACAQLLAIEQYKGTVISKSQGEVDTIKAEYEEKISVLEAEKAELQEKINEISLQKTQADGELEQMKAALEESDKNLAEVSKMAQKAGEVEVLKEQLAQMQIAHAEEKAELEAQIVKAKDMFAAEEKKNFNMEAERRKLQNTIQELRGNVRVFARLRPFLPNDNIPTDEQLSAIDSHMDGATMIIKDPKTVEGPGDPTTHKFSYDKSFAPHIGQEEVFAEVSEFVQSALDGYNVTLFSYGQTGSGKTHTMMGSGNGNMRGIIPRAIEQVGASKERLEKQGWKFEMKVTFVEIYNEILKDLLNDDGREQNLNIIRDAYGMTEVTDVTLIPVNPADKDEIDKIMDIASRNRSVASTDMNAQSSRSHSIFTLHLVAFNAGENAVLRGQLNLCDLAGSERVDRSGAQGKALTEAKNINKSLSCLTDVFVNLQQKSQHIPFRNSKLTYLLQPSFSGDGKTLMMINLSPTQMSYFESLSTLRFGSMVNSCELGQAKRKLNDIDADKRKKGGAEGPGGVKRKESLRGGRPPGDESRPGVKRNESLRGGRKATTPPRNKP